MVLKSLTRDGLVIERSFLLILVGGLIYACFQVVAPFIPAFIWALILSISTWPYFQFLSKKLGDRENIAALILTLTQLMVFVVPALFALDALTTHVPKLESVIEPVMEWFKSPPPAWLDELPLVGDNLKKIWEQAHFSSIFSPDRVRSLLSTLGGWILNGGANLALNTINVILAVLMAGFLYSYGEKGSSFAVRFAMKVGGQSAVTALRTAADTVHAVSMGVIGTALIQALFSGVGFAIAGINGAAVLGLLCFLTAVLQIGTGVVWLPVAGWLYHLDENGWALFTVIWGLIINIMDGVIKPYFIGLSSPLPFLLITVGVIGGLIAWGFVGIFLGTSLLAVAYSAFFSWLESSQENTPSEY